MAIQAAAESEIKWDIGCLSVGFRCVGRSGLPARKETLKKNKFLL